MKIKRILSCVIAIVMLFGSVSFASTTETQTKEKQTKVINEYSKIKELKSKSDEELKEIGIKDEDIKALKAIDYSKHIKDLNKKDDTELKGLGYSDEKIKKIRDFQGTDAEVMALSATLYLTVELAHETSTSSNSGVTYEISWSWSSCPVWTLTDYLGICWSDGFYTDTSSTNVIVYYQMNLNSSNQVSKQYSPKVVPGAGCTFDIPMKTNVTSNYFYWAFGGFGSVKMYYPGRKTSCEYLVAYGHTYITATGGIDIKGTPSISFTGTTGEENRFQDVWQY